MLTDSLYVTFRLRRLWAALTGQPLPAPPLPPTGSAQRAAGEDLGALDVDLVYLWVSGQDPAQVRKRNDWLRKCGLPAAVFNPDVRYVEDDELRYALRSADRFLPWIRRVYIVTDGQAPAWLDRRNPRLQVVEQASLFPDPACLPTFNSVAIEAQLHNIPGLAEHFIYSNDDYFFGQSCAREDFFAASAHGGQSAAVMKVMPSEMWITPAHRVTRDPLARLWMYSYNSLKLVLEARRPWHKVRHVDCHQAQSMVKSRLRETTHRFPRLYRQISASRFRSANDVNFLALTRYVALQRGLAVHGFLPRQFFRHESELARWDAAALPALFCVNEGQGQAADGGERALARLFPRPSSFERPARKPDHARQRRRAQVQG